MLKRYIIPFFITLIFIQQSHVLAGNRVQIPVSGYLFKEYAKLENIIKSLKKSSPIKLDGFYKVVVKDGDELLVTDDGKTTLEIDKKLIYKTTVYIKKISLSAYSNFNVIFMDYDDSELKLIASAKIPQETVDSLFKKPPSIQEALNNVMDKLDRIEKMTVQQRFLALIDKKPDLSLQLGEDVSLEIVYVKPGKFLMGTNQDELDELTVESKTHELQKEGPAHIVNVPKFYLGKYEITNKQYGLFLKETKSKNINRLKKQANKKNWDSMPVVNVSWYEAMEFTKWLSAKLLLNVRLPMEEEWEWGGRGPENLRYPWGNQRPKRKKGYGIWGEPFGKPGKVGSCQKGKSWCGAYDMAGNVYEWTYNPYYEYHSESRNIPAKQEKSYVVRGGSFANKLFECRSASRYVLSPDTKKTNVGFRIIISFSNIE